MNRFAGIFGCGLAMFLLIQTSAAQTPAPAGTVRAWTDQLGRVSRAAYVSATDTAVVLRLENGNQASIPIAVLSKADQLYIQQQKARPVAPANSPFTPTAKPLVWPAVVSVDSKALNIVTGKQDTATRQFQYESGSFEFTANAPISATVMRDVAIDFELGEALFNQLPWGWQPKPKNGPHFRVFLTETPEDFAVFSNMPRTSGGSKDDFIYQKMSAMGLKQVGQRYAFDYKLKKEGDVLGLTYRLLAGEMRPFTLPWSQLGFEELIRHVAYHSGTLRFSGLEPFLKAQIESRARQEIKPEVKRLLAYLHMPRSEEHAEDDTLLRQYYFDGLLLVYYFGFLDGDGKGTRLHQYYQSIAQEALAARGAREAGTPSAVRASDRAMALVDVLTAGRTEAQLHDELVAKYRTIGVKLQ